MKKTSFGALLLSIVISSCSLFRPGGKTDDGKIAVNFILINDVYEIAPLSGGKEGGMARIATLKKQYLASNRNTFLVMAGDFLSPSVYNSLKYEGKYIRGRQMVEAMNVAGVDFACFGNHEFDIREEELQERLDESRFQWISSNVFHNTKTGIVPFASNGKAFPRTWIETVKDADGTIAKIGFIGICLPFNRANYVYYENALEAAQQYYNALKDSVDAVVAITHQNIEEDKQLAAAIPGLAVILGGHEHDQRFEKIGDVYITKSMSNAKTAFVVELNMNVRKNRRQVVPKVEIINETIPLDSVTNAVVAKWTALAAQSFSSLGFNTSRIILSKGEDLDGREAYIRRRPTNLGRLITEAVLHHSPNTQVVLFNAGSIRVDDILHLPLTEYDVIRAMPFGGGMREIDMKGSLLLKVLEQGDKNAGSGGYLVRNKEIENKDGVWMLQNIKIDPAAIYRVAVSDFLLTGREVNFDFLNEKNPEITRAYPAPEAGSVGADIRRIVIRYLDDQQ